MIIDEINKATINTYTGYSIKQKELLITCVNMVVEYYNRYINSKDPITTEKVHILGSQTDINLPNNDNEMTTVLAVDTDPHLHYIVKCYGDKKWDRFSFASYTKYI